MNNNSSILLTSSYSRLRSALSMQPNECRPVFYIPQGGKDNNQYVEAITGILTKIYHQIEEVGVAVGDILVVTTMGTWVLRGFEGREPKINN